MKSQIKIRGNSRNILVILPALFIMLFATAIMLPVVPESTHAEGDEQIEGTYIITSPNVEVTLLSKDDGYYKIFKDTITAGTDCYGGYTLYISTDTQEHQTLYLNGDTSSESKINNATGTYEEPKALNNYEWGFAVPGINYFDKKYSTTNPNANSKFAALPLEEKVIHDYPYLTAEDTTDIYYGFKLGGPLELGKYETTVTYTVSPQDSELLPKAILGDNGNLNFVYDRNYYWSGETYTDNIGETEIVEVFDVPTNSSEDRLPEWVYNENYKSVNFEPSFYGFKPTSTSYWFYGDCNFYESYLTTVTNANNLNTSNVTDMSSMFTCAGWTDYDSESWTADLSSWDTSNVTNMSNMFSVAGINASTWTVGDLSGWDTSKVTDMSYLFQDAGRNASAWAIDLSSWNTDNVTNMKGMFYGTGKNSNTWTVNLNRWKTINVTDMSVMFNSAGQNASTWTALGLDGWKTANVTTMLNMFGGAGKNANVWALDLSSWNTGNVTNMYRMFYQAGLNAETWTVGDISDWNVDNVTDHTDFIYFPQAQTNIDRNKLPW